MSGLSFYEYATFIGHYQHLASGKAGTEQKLETRGYSEAALKELEQHERKMISTVESQGLRFKRPLKEYESDILEYALQLHENYERGQLPFPGSVSEQPAQIIQIFNLLSSLRNERVEKQNKREEKNGKHKHKNLARTR